MIYDPKAYAEACAAVMKMDGPQLLAYLDELYGRENLPRSCMIEDIRNEALAQTEKRYGEDYERFLLSRKNAFTALVRGRGGDEAGKDDTSAL
jgi:hypothetical protein